MSKKMDSNSRDIANIIIKSFWHDGKLLVCGNGGSASMSDHFVAELVGQYKIRRKALPAISLTCNSAILTAIANDYSYDDVFSRQVEALGKKGDVLVVLSTSGKSKNCLKAIKIAKKMELVVIDFPRRGKETAEIQEFQLNLIHNVCELVERDCILSVYV